MKKNLALTALSSALIVSMALTANTAMAANTTIKINGNACGNYTGVTFDQNGNMSLAGNLTCLAGGGPLDPVDPVDPVDPGNPGNPACGTAPSGLIVKDDFDWLAGIDSDIRNAIKLTPTQVYSVKIKNQGGARAYGHLNTLNTIYEAGARKVVVSECPGSMVPVGEVAANGRNACEVNGVENKLSWSFDSKSPRGVGQCRLDPSKQYYVNIKHLDEDGKNSCKAGLCQFTYSYRMQTF